MLQGLPNIPTSSRTRLQALPMLAEHLSERRIPSPPGFHWRKLRGYLRDLDWFLEHQDKLGKSFRHWLRSDQAFTVLPYEDLMPEIRVRCARFQVGIHDIATVLGEYPTSTLTSAQYVNRSRLYWHLCGMPLDLLRRHARLSAEDLRQSILMGFEEVAGRIGFQVFAHQVDVSCIIGGDEGTPYLKRLLLANGYARRPMAVGNQVWGKCVTNLYIRYPSNLVAYAGTGTPHHSTSPIQVSPQRRPLGRLKKLEGTSAED